MNVVDGAVFAAYGWPEGIVDEEEKVLKNHLALNSESSALR